MKIYQDKAFLYEHYVTKRMNIKDICDLLQKRYNVTISTQGLYNWIKKFDLLKYRGKGRNLGANLQQKNKVKQQRRPNRQEQILKEKARLRKQKKRAGR